MGTMEFISSLAGSVAWPLAVIVCVVILRGQIGGLLQRVQSLEIGGQKATFGALGRVEDTVAKVVSSTREDEIGEYRPDERTADAVWDPIIARASVSPRTAVLEGWSRLEHELNVLADAVDPTAPHGWPDVIVHLPILDDWAGLRPALRELRHLRDTAASDPLAPSAADAGRYVSVARDLSRSLDAIAAVVADRPTPSVASEPPSPERIGSGQ